MITITTRAACSAGQWIASCTASIFADEKSALTSSVGSWNGAERTCLWVTWSCYNPSLVVSRMCFGHAPDLPTMIVPAKIC